MINFLIENWLYIIIAIAVIGVVIFAIYKFLKLPKSEQIAKIQEWLLWAVAEAEKALGSGTGQLKLRYVYNMFINTFPALAKIVPFEMFSGLVDKALEKFNDILSNNKKVEAYIVENKE